jgi:hypothetical protein
MKAAGARPCFTQSGPTPGTGSAAPTPTSAGASNFCSATASGASGRTCWSRSSAGVSDKTVAAVRGALVSTSEVPECPIRKTADGRKMRTGRIGRQPSPAQSAGRTGLRHRATGDRANPDQDPEAAATPAPSADFRAELAPDSPHDSTGQPEFSSTTPRSVNGRWQSLDEAAAKVLIHLVAFAATDPNGAACWRDEHFDAVTAAISVKGAQGGSIGRLRMHPPR